MNPLKITEYTKQFSFKTNRNINEVKEETILYIYERLNSSKPSTIERKEDHIYFYGGVFRFVWNWNLLNAISKGHIYLKQDHNISITYTIKFTEIFIISFAFSLSSLFIVQGLIAKLTVPLILFFWAYSVNILITIFRFNKFIRKCINNIIKNDSPEISVEQTQWINDPNRCAACGYPIKQEDIDCPDCGIKL
ncbi:MAG: hypothetical protein HYZ42_06495 [Bacteroidetes bacterium]|nr:hypothetical protein [Bacteroidota bacterium]